MTRHRQRRAALDAQAPPVPGSCLRSGRRWRSRSPTSSPTSGTRTTQRGEPLVDAFRSLVGPLMQASVLRRGSGSYARRPHLRRRARLGHAEDALHPVPGRLQTFGADWPWRGGGSCALHPRRLRAGSDGELHDRGTRARTPAYPPRSSSRPGRRLGPPRRVDGARRAPRRGLAGTALLTASASSTRSSSKVS